MCRQRVWLCAVAALCLGCPEDFGMGGTIDDAMRKDIQARLEDKNAYECPPREEVQRRCADPKSERCPQECR